MKKMKLYMLLLLVPLILMGCIEKGKPASGISVDVDGTNVTINKTLSEIIKTNISYLKSTYELSGLSNKELLNPNISTSITSLLNKIQLGYYYGNVTNVEISKLNQDVLTNKDILFSSNSLLTYDNIVSTHSNVVKQIDILNQDPNSNPDHIAHLGVIQSKLNEYILELEDVYKSNPYYIELKESGYLKNWLDNKNTSIAPTLTYYNLLKEYNVLANSTLQEKYTNLLNLIKIDLKILNGVDVTTDLDNLLSNNNYIVDNFYTKDILSSAQVAEIRKQMLNLQDLYTNYRNNSANISTAELNFYLLEREYLLTTPSTYLYKVRMSGTKLSITTENNIDYLQKLKDIYLMSNNKLSSTEDRQLLVLYKNLEYLLIKLTEYDALSPKTAYSSVIRTAQLLQLLKDNLSFINYVIDLHS